MAKSMTGYGRAEEILHGRSLAVEIKSVNSRYFEYNARMPRSYSFMDDALKKTVNAAVSRGKVELHLSAQSIEQGETEIRANLAVARGYQQAMQEIARELAVTDDVTVTALARFQDIFTVLRSEVDEQQLREDVLQVAQSALARYNEMRQTEGDKLKADILARLADIEQMLAQVEEGSAGRVQRHTDKLYERLREVLENRSIDDARILTEAAIFADKTALDEETVRLHSHIKQYREILSQKGAVGRKLDFLTQELNREVNTIGSKCQELEITRIVVDMKAEIEKIREQIQNLE